MNNIDNISGNDRYEYTFDILDINYIYNLTKRFSNIIFTEYQEEYGEIGKGRAYGTKGEHKAAEILFENFSNLGLFTFKEQITNTKDFEDLTKSIQIIDYYVKLNGDSIHSYISPVWVKNSQNNYNLNFTYNYSNLKVVKPPLKPYFELMKQKKSDEIDPFLLILEDRAFYPYNPLSKIPILDNFYFNYYFLRILQSLPEVFYSSLYEGFSDYCKAIIIYDFNENTIDMNLFKPYNHLPIISINGTTGKRIIDNIENARIDFKLQQQLNKSIISYNIIGQLNGSDQSKTIIVDSLYDSWWCQGTADSAIAMSMVLGIAKFLIDKNIKPKYTIKFIGFSGEEQGPYAGAKHYASRHKDENIITIIDLNQIGFKQDDPLLVLNIIGNKLKGLIDVYNIVQQSNYVNRVNSSRDLKYVWLKRGVVSNPNPFVTTHPNCSSFTFLKDSGWKFHHRDGLNHTTGDVISYFDPEDVLTTGELILNVLKYYAMDWY
jgi:hypothetical protein